MNKKEAVTRVIVVAMAKVVSGALNELLDVIAEADNDHDITVLSQDYMTKLEVASIVLESLETELLGG